MHGHETGGDSEAIHVNPHPSKQLFMKMTRIVKQHFLSFMKTARIGGFIIAVIIA